MSVWDECVVPADLDEDRDQAGRRVERPAENAHDTGAARGEQDRQLAMCRETQDSQCPDTARQPLSFCSVSVVSEIKKPNYCIAL